MITEETRLKLRLSHLGHKHSEEQKRKIGLAALGNKYSLGKIPWNKGKRGEYTLKHSGQFKKGFTPWNKGMKMPHYHNTGRKKGHIPWNKGIKYLAISGEKHPMWKGGVSRGYKTGYHSSEYKNWRRDVFVRDQFTCQDCGATHTYITAHHIKSFAHYPELRFDLDNGRTLCEPCHKLTDNYAGRKIKRR